MFNALDIMDNNKILEELKFGVGDGNLHYYLYNWKCPSMPPTDVCGHLSQPTLSFLSLSAGCAGVTIVCCGVVLLH